MTPDPTLLKDYHEAVRSLCDIAVRLLDSDYQVLADVKVELAARRGLTVKDIEFDENYHITGLP